MRGKVLGYDPKSGTGMISGDDGTRYTAAMADIRGGATMLAPGREVDFHPGQNGMAVDIYPIGGISAVTAEKSRLVAAALAFFLGAFGIHKFYLGKNTAGVIMLLCFFPGMFLVLPAIVSSIIAFIEFIIYLVKDDQTFHEQYVAGEKAWF
jgi:TM2 domain-containing membrane protein YozV/cold shock CspA family protein